MKKMNKKQLKQLRTQVKNNNIEENGRVTTKEEVYAIVRKRLKKLGKVSFNEEEKVVTLFLNKVMGISLIANLKTKVGYEKWNKDFVPSAIEFSKSIDETLQNQYQFNILRPDSKLIDNEYLSDDDLVLSVSDAKVTFDYVATYIDQKSLTDEIDPNTKISQKDVIELAKSVDVDDKSIKENLKS